MVKNALNPLKRIPNCSKWLKMTQKLFNDKNLFEYTVGYRAAARRIYPNSFLRLSYLQESFMATVLLALVSLISVT